jgi:hypothetical protein
LKRALARQRSASCCCDQEFPLFLAQ